MLLAGEGGWGAWPDPCRLTFAGVSLTRLRADCPVERRRSDLASVRRARSGGGLRNGARAMSGPSARAATPFATDRGACRADPFGGDRQERHDPGGTARAAEGTRRRRRHRHALAVLQTSQDHAQKKTAHAAEQRRSGVNAAREAWFEGQLDLDPTRTLRRGSSSSTRPPRTPKWRAFTVVRRGASDAADLCPTAIGKPPPSRWASPRPDRCAHGPGWPDER